MADRGCISLSWVKPENAKNYLRDQACRCPLSAHLRSTGGTGILELELSATIAPVPPDAMLVAMAWRWAPASAPLTSWSAQAAAPREK